MALINPSARAPLPNSYWVSAGKLLGGEYPGGESEPETRQRLRALMAAGVNCFIDLTGLGELPSYQALLPESAWYLHLPIQDHGLPLDRSHMCRIQSALGSALAAGRCVYVHCRMGIGRTGTVLGCQLVEQGLTAEAALDQLNRAWQQSARAQRWPSIPETQEQRRFVAAWEPGEATNAAADRPADFPTRG